MRFRLTLNNPTNNTLIGWNYEYLLMSWIYRKLEAADPDYAHFLHQEGYQNEGNNKKFKYLTFSPFHFHPKKGEYTVDKKKGLWVHGQELFLDLSFYMPKAAESFILGVFRDQQLKIFNHRFRVDLSIVQIATLPEPEFTTTMHYQSWSALNVVLNLEDEKYGQYVPPNHPEFERLLAINLRDKYHNASGEKIALEDIKFSIQQPEKDYKTHLMVIHEKSNEQSEVRGYKNVSFQLQAPVEVQKCGYYSGFGRFNAEGMGMVKKV